MPALTDPALRDDRRCARLGIPGDRFVDHGSVSDLRRALRLDVPGLTEQVREAIAQVGAVPQGEQGAPAEGVVRSGVRADHRWRSWSRHRTVRSMPIVPTRSRAPAARRRVPRVHRHGLYRLVCAPGVRPPRPTSARWAARSRRRPARSRRDGVDPLAAGEPMANAPIGRLPLRQVGDAARDRGLKVTWRYTYSTGPDMGFGERRRHPARGRRGHERRLRDGER